jgi:hypothetical protein
MEKLMPHASVNANELMDNMMQWDPSRRPTFSELLKHSYFQLETVEVSSQVAHTSFLVSLRPKVELVFGLTESRRFWIS